MAHVLQTNKVLLAYDILQLATAFFWKYRLQYGFDSVCIVQRGTMWNHSEASSGSPIRPAEVMAGPLKLLSLVHWNLTTGPSSVMLENTQTRHGAPACTGHSPSFNFIGFGKVSKVHFKLHFLPAAVRCQKHVWQLACFNTFHKSWTQPEQLAGGIQRPVPSCVSPKVRNPAPPTYWLVIDWALILTNYT